MNVVIVSDFTQQTLYCGRDIPHLRHANRFHPSKERSVACRQTFGVPTDKYVVLFYGTPRKHKGVTETARALAALGRDDVCYVIAGGEPDAGLKAELEGIPGVDYIFLGSQPYERAADVVAMGDICILLQDATSQVGQFQLPAKLMDALGMGLTVFAQVTPPLEELAKKGAFIPVTADNLVDQLRSWFDSGDRTQAQRERVVIAAESSVE